MSNKDKSESHSGTDQLQTLNGQCYRYRNAIPQVHSSAFIAPTACLIGDVTVAENASVWFGAVLRGDEVPIHIGANSNVQDNVVIHGDEGGEVLVEDNVTIGHGAIIHGCQIQSGALIGMGAVVLDGVIVESGALVAAGAVVSPGKCVTANTLWAGCPARPIRALDPSQNTFHESAEHYRALSLEYRSDKVSAIEALAADQGSTS